MVGMRRRLVWMGGGLAVVLCLQVMIFELATVPPEDDNVDDAGGGTPHNHQEQRPLNFVPITVAPAVTIITAYPSFPPSSRVEVSSAVASTTLVATQGPTTASPTPIPPSTLSSPPPTDSTKPCTVHEADAVFALERARTPQCSKLISATACADEDGSLYPELHPNPLPSCSGPLLKDGNKMLARPLHGGGGAVATAAAAAPLRIAYMIVCHGRSLRQVKRLLRLLYDPRHFIMIHVDSRSAYMHRHLVTLVDQLGPNVWLTPWRLATIWGGLNLYQMYLRAIRELLEHPWDYFINLSGADLPIVPLSNLTAFLQRFRPHRANFLKSHSNQKSFVRKQGLNKTWVLCDNHMWRTGPRSFPPRGMRVEGGSDWYIMHRSFCEFVTSDSDPFIRNLTKWYDQSLLGAESFFHTALSNGPMCDTLVGKNHRLANWNYARGCKCQYKEIVDWCGCSPNVFWVDDKPKLLQSVSTGGVFARKFDGKICNSMIEFVETELVHAAPFTAMGFYWESVFEVDDGGGSQAGPVTYFASFARLGVNHLMETCTNGSGLDQESTTLLESHLVMKDDSFLGYAVKISVASGAGTIVFEVLVTTDDEFLFSQTPRNGGGSSVMGPLGVGVGYDGKERVFNRRGGMLTSADSPMIAGLWPTQSPLTMSFEWRGPDAASTVQSTQTHGVGREKLLLMHQLNKRLAPGTWVATIKPGQQPEYKRPPKSEFTLRFPVAEVHPVGTTRLATLNAYLNGGVVSGLGLTISTVPPHHHHHQNIRSTYNHSTRRTTSLLHRFGRSGECARPPPPQCRAS